MELNAYGFSGAYGAYGAYGARQEHHGALFPSNLKFQNKCFCCTSVSVEKFLVCNGYQISRPLTMNSVLVLTLAFIGGVSADHLKDDFFLNNRSCGGKPSYEFRNEIGCVSDPASFSFLAPLDTSSFKIQCNSSRKYKYLYYPTSDCSGDHLTVDVDDLFDDDVTFDDDFDDDTVLATNFSVMMTTT
jgi:hypothetical protein